MSQLKQNILVVAILFLSLLSSVALSYAITPSDVVTPESSQLEIMIKEDKKTTKILKQAMIILLPKVAG